jgi:metal-dependent HD superfamily phosphatase/phosphodiesterase
MNTMRMNVVRAIYDDDELKTILSTNGDIRYAGTVTDMASGRSMEGQMHIRVTFTYPLLPAELL